MPIYPRNKTVIGYEGSTMRSYGRKTGYVSKDMNPRPPLNYTNVLSRAIRLDDFPTLGATNTRAYKSLLMEEGEPLLSAARNRAYARFKSLAYDSAEAGLLFAERKEALGLMVQRLISLRKAFGALRKGRFGDFLKALDARPVPRHKRTKWTRPKDASALWLEYWFGWSPLVADIYAIASLLEGEYEPPQVRASSFAKRALKGGSWVNPNYYNTYSGFATARSTYRGRVVVTNPNLFRARQLGLINPVGIAWELVPFSFVVDWFLPVGDFLNQWQDWVGLSISDASESMKITIDTEERYKVNASNTFHTYAKVLKFQRVIGFTVPPILWEPGYKHGVTRALTQVSLLISLFTKG